MAYDVGTDARAVATIDFNNDGNLDLATANYHGATGTHGERYPKNLATIVLK